MLKVCFISMKGGTGKTTLSVLFSYYLVQRGLSVLLMDMDPQGNATIALAESKVFDDRGFLTKGFPFVIESFLSPGFSREDFGRVVSSNIEELDSVKRETNFHLLPNFLESHKYDLHLVSNHAVPVFVREILDSLNAGYDAVVMDCPPYLSSLSYAALYGADVIVIPAEASKFGLVGVELLLTVVGDVVRRRNAHYKNIIIQPNRIKNTKACIFYLEAMREKYAQFVSPVFVKETVEVPRMVRDGVRSFGVGMSAQRLQAVEAMEALFDKVFEE